MLGLREGAQDFGPGRARARVDAKRAVEGARTQRRIFRARAHPDPHQGARRTLLGGRAGVIVTFVGEARTWSGRGRHRQGRNEQMRKARHLLMFSPFDTWFFSLVYTLTMPRDPFDPDGAVEFDLPRGIVRGAGERLLVVPASLLEEIAASAGAQAAVSVAHAIGAACGQRAAHRMGGVDAARGASVEEAITFLAGELSIAGLGVFGLERWGRALVVAVANAPTRDPGVMAALVEGAVGSISDKPVAALTIAREGDIARVLVASATAVLRAKGLLESGVSWGDALTKLHARGDA